MRIAEAMNTPGQWLVVFQSRCEYTGKFKTNDWRAYRKWSVYPILFHTKEQAEKYIKCLGDDLFNGLTGHKMSCSAMPVSSFRRNTRGTMKHDS